MPLEWMPCPLSSLVDEAVCCFLLILSGCLRETKERGMMFQNPSPARSAFPLFETSFDTMTKKSCWQSGSIYLPQKNQQSMNCHTINVNGV
jgi:hypothetical protein